MDPESLHCSGSNLDCLMRPHAAQWMHTLKARAMHVVMTPQPKRLAFPECNVTRNGNMNARKQHLSTMWEMQRSQHVIHRIDVMA